MVNPPEGRSTYIVRSLVVTARMARAFPLDEIDALLAGRASHGKRETPWVGLRLGKRYAAVYPNGNVAVTGCRTLEEVRLVLQDLESTLGRYVEGAASSVDLEIQNIVATADVGRSVNLESAMVAWSWEQVEFEPEQFPGLILHLDDPRAVVLVFSSGRLVLTGIRDFGVLDEAVERVRTLVRGVPA